MLLGKYATALQQRGLYRLRDGKINLEKIMEGEKFHESKCFSTDNFLYSIYKL